MPLAFIDDNQIERYPVGLVEINRRFPNTSFSLPLEDQDLSDFGVTTVVRTEPPEFDPDFETLVEDTPTLVEDKWQQVWNVIALPAEVIQDREEQVIRSVRDERNGLLAESDWTQLPDSPVDSEPWAVYRQALRDLPSQTGFPHDVTWPTQP